jgi:hypothetical protein
MGTPSTEVFLVQRIWIFLLLEAVASQKTEAPGLNRILFSDADANGGGGSGATLV